MDIKLEKEKDTLTGPEQLREDVMEANLRAQPNSEAMELSPEGVKRALQEEGADNQMLQDSDVGNDMVRSFNQLPDEGTGEAPAFGTQDLTETTTGEPAPMDMQENNELDEDEENSLTAAPRPSPFKNPYG